MKQREHIRLQGYNSKRIRIFDKSTYYDTLTDRRWRYRVLDRLLKEVNKHNKKKGEQIIQATACKLGIFNSRVDICYIDMTAINNPERTMREANSHD